MRPADPVGTSRREGEPDNGAGRAAMQVGVVAVIAALVPFIGDVIAAPFALVAVVLGVVGYVRTERGTATNPGQAAAGGVLGVAAGLIILAMHLITSAGP